MASNYTSNYGLCQWEPGDKVLRSEFNGDNAKLDAAIKAVDSRVDGKASNSALNSLKNTVNSLSTTIAGQGNTLEKKGNCQVVVSTYTGDGKNSRTHTFPKKPVMFFIIGECIMFVGYGSTWAKNHGISDYEIRTAWSGNSVTFSMNSASPDYSKHIANRSGITYQMITLYDQEA